MKYVLRAGCPIKFGWHVPKGLHTLPPNSHHTCQPSQTEHGGWREMALNMKRWESQGVEQANGGAEGHLLLSTQTVQGSSSNGVKSDSPIASHSLR